LTLHRLVERKDYAKHGQVSTMTESGLSIQTMILLALLAGVVVWRMKKMFGDGE
jgi:hypothetical protein